MGSRDDLTIRSNDDVRSVYLTVTQRQRRLVFII